MTSIYLDHAATTPLHPAVLDRMLPYMTEYFGNPSSIHSYGRAARFVMNDARDSLAQGLHCESGQLILTSGGTESDNLAIFGSVLSAGVGKHIITSQIEHHAVLHPCKRLEKMGYDVTYLPVDSTGMVRVEDLEASIRPNTVLISIMYGNNEVGTIQPIVAIGQIARNKGILFHVDAVQALGSLELDLSSLPVDLLSLSAHKIQGPKGVGLLYVSKKIKLTPQLLGGSQERKRRAGTENVAGLVGFVEAARIAVLKSSEKRQAMLTLRQTMLDALATHVGQGNYIVNGHSSEYVPHILNVSFPGVPTETMLMNLDLEGIAAASGSACTSGSLEVSHVLQAMQLPEEITSSAVRFSFGLSNTPQEMEFTAKIIATILQRIRTK